MKKLFVHLPLPYFFSDQLVRTFFAQGRVFARSGIFTPDPRTYQKMAKYCLVENPSIENQTIFKCALAGNFPKDADRMIISFHGVPRCPSEIVSKEGLIPNLSEIVWRLKNVFADFEITIGIGIVNIGSLIEPLVANNVISYGTIDKALSASSLYWSDAIGACKDEYGDIEFLVWRHEDSPVIWPDIVSFLANLSDYSPVPGSLDMLVTKLTNSGRKALNDLLSKADTLSRREICEIIAFFDNSRSFRVREDRSKACRVLGRSRVMVLNEIYAEDEALLRDDPGMIFVNKEQIHGKVGGMRWRTMR